MINIQEFDYSVDLSKAMLWQYQNATNLRSLIAQKQAWYDKNQRDFWRDWFDNVFNLTTANEFGCSVWAIILNIPLSANDPPPPTDYIPWGFGDDNQNFFNANFLAQNGSTITLTLDQKRIVLRLRAFQLFSSGTVPEVNRFLKYLFEPNYGKAFLLDNGSMSQTYVFEFALDPNLQAVIEQFDLLPRPAGVESSILIQANIPFGFGVFNQNFYNSNFLF